MSFRLYKARLKCIVRNKESIFWSFVFPIALVTCFFFAFNNLWSVESFQTINIAYLSKNEEQEPLKEALEQAEIREGTKMFQVIYPGREEASSLLDKDEIEAYIIGSMDPELYVKSSELNETIIKSFLDSYKRMMATTQNILSSNPEAMNQGLMEELMQTKEYVREIKNEKKPDAVLIYFYSLLALTCLFAVNIGLDEVINVQADQSGRGARVNVAPIRKMTLFISNLMAGFTVHILSILILFIYMNNILGISFGDNLIYTFVVCFIGSLAGIFLGATVGVWVKKKVSVKSAILTSIVMGGSFLSGMMFADMKYIVATKAPFLSYINPVNLVSDSLYSLYYYDTYEHFYLNMAILCFMVLGMGVLSYLGLRRKTYASI